MLNVTCNFNELILDAPNLVMLDASECKSLKKIQNVTDVKVHPSKLHTVSLLRCPQVRRLFSLIIHERVLICLYLQLEGQSVSEFLQTCDAVEDVNLFSCATLTSKEYVVLSLLSVTHVSHCLVSQLQHLI